MQPQPESAANTRAGEPIDVGRLLGIQEALGLNNREAAWLWSIGETTWYRWLKDETPARLGPSHVLVGLMEKAVFSKGFRTETLHGYMGLHFTSRRGVHRPDASTRTDPARLRAWAYVARCAFTESELRQERFA